MSAAISGTTASREALGCCFAHPGYASCAIPKIGGAITIAGQVVVGTCVTLYLSRAFVENGQRRELNQSN
jgi:hypothetical protein